MHSYVPASASAGVSAGGSVANEGKDSREIKPEPGHTFTSHPVGATSAAAAAGGKGTSSFTGSKPPLQPKASLAAAATSATASGVRGEAVATRCTSLHTLTGYLDIGNDDLFGEDKEWVRPACERLVLPSQAKSVRSEKQ